MVTFLIFSAILASCLGQKNYFIDARQNCNNVYDAVSDPNKSGEYVEFLGVVSDTEACIQACISKSTESNRCESYTYHTKEFGGDYASHCYGRFGSPYGLLWTPVQQDLVNCGRIIYKCKSDIDCSLNGKCETMSGNCTCRTAWSGYHCQELNLLPVTKGTGYHIVNDDNSGKPTSSWGGGVVFDTSSDAKQDTKYHMYLAEFNNHCGVNSWTINSVVTHAQSTGYVFHTFFECSNCYGVCSNFEFINNRWL